MILLGLCAFIAGICVGWISLRALGWFCILALFALPAHAVNVTIRMHNTSASTLYYSAYCDYNCDENWALKINNVGVTAGNTDTRYNLGGVGSQTKIKIVWKTSGLTEIKTDVSPCLSADGEWDTYCDGTAGTINYYASGCVTNRTGYLQRYYFSTSLGTTEVSPIIPPNGYWCVSFTNTNNFTYRLERQSYNSDGGTNNWDFDLNRGVDFPAWTNSIPPTGGTGSHDDPGGRGNNMGPDTGYGSTNAVTGGQYAAGTSNVINQLYGGFQDLARGLGTLNSSNQANASAGLLSAISNNTAVATNTLREILDQTGTNAFGTNMTAWGVSVLSNAAITTITTLSNNWFNTFYGTEEQAAFGSVTQLANQASPSLWIVPVRTNTTTTAGMNINPRNTTLWQNIAPWVRLIFYFTGTIFALLYIKYRIQETAVTMGLVPGSAPWKSVGSAFASVASAVVVGIIFAVLPVIGMSIISWLSDSGSLTSPLSQTGVATAGNYATAIQEGINIATDLMPLDWMLAVMVYLAIFDMTAAAFLIGAQRALRWVQS